MTLDAAFIESQKKRLLAEQKDLKERLARIANKDPHVEGDYDALWPQYGEDLDRDYENAEETEDYVNAIGVENVLELRLAAVERALRRIEKGTYGACSNCKAVHVKERLKVNPAAERCRECGVVE